MQNTVWKRIRAAELKVLRGEASGVRSERVRNYKTSIKVSLSKQQQPVTTGHHKWGGECGRKDFRHNNNDNGLMLREPTNHHIENLFAIRREEVNI